MNYPPHVWKQIRNVTASELIKALQRDGFKLDETHGAEQVYRHPDGRRVSIHFHPRKTYGPRLLKSLLRDIGWTPEDMRHPRATT